MPLTPEQRLVVNYYEQIWFTENRIPTEQDVAAALAIPPQDVKKYLANPQVRDSLDSRGIEVSERRGQQLSTEELMLANLLLVNDGRSRKKKLQDAGITAAKAAAIEKRTTFRNYIRQRAEQELGDVIPKAHMALIDNVERGDMNAIKFAYEITGHYNPRTGDTLDVQAFMIRILETIQKYVKDPNVLTAIANDLGTFASGATAGRQALPSPVEAPTISLSL